jgi:replicative DNA helicase
MPDGSATKTAQRFDEEAEQACLSAALNDHDSALELVELLAESDFYFDANRQILGAIRAVCVRGDQVDLVSVVAELRAATLLDRVGGSPYVARLVGLPSVVHVEQHARIVRNWARVRRAQNAFRQLVAEATAGELTDVDAWLDSCERRAYEATSSEQTAKAHSAGYREIWSTMKAKWDEADARSERTLGTATGFHRLDEHTGGMRPGQLWYVGARPGQGKTVFLQQVLEHVACRGMGLESGIMSSQEMTKEELFPRALAREAKLGHRKIERRSLDRDQWASVAEAANRVQAYPLEIDDEKRITPLKLRAKIRRLNAKIGSYAPKAKLRVVGVDYVQLMRPDIERTGENRATELGAISRALKELAGEFECTVLVMSQLARHTDKSKAPPAPTLFDFRDSGSIEADGDVVIGLHRPDQWLKPGVAPDHICQVHVLKGRGCGEASFELLFDGPTTRFENIDVGDDKLWKVERE